MADLWLVFVIGLLGSAHCVGMCGGFALALVGQGGATGRIIRHQLLYYAGKTLTYAALGAGVGSLGAAFGMAFGGAQRVLSIVLGLFLVWIALGLLGALRGRPGSIRLPGLTAALAFFMRRRSPLRTLGLGLVNGLLPCALVYGMLAQAASTGTVAAGAATMAAFGLGTLPALALVASMGRLASPLWRRRVNLAGGVLVLLLGLLTLTRGLLPSHQHPPLPDDVPAAHQSHGVPAHPSTAP